MSFRLGKKFLTTLAAYKQDQSVKSDWEEIQLTEDISAAESGSRGCRVTIVFAVVNRCNAYGTRSVASSLMKTL